MVMDQLLQDNNKTLLSLHRVKVDISILVKLKWVSSEPFLKLIIYQKLLCWLCATILTVFAKHYPQQHACWRFQITVAQNNPSLFISWVRYISTVGIVQSQPSWQLGHKYLIFEWKLQAPNGYKDYFSDDSAAQKLKIGHLIFLPIPNWMCIFTSE